MNTHIQHVHDGHVLLLHTHSSPRLRVVTVEATATHRLVIAPELYSRTSVIRGAPYRSGGMHANK